MIKTKICFIERSFLRRSYSIENMVKDICFELNKSDFEIIRYRHPSKFFSLKLIKFIFQLINKLNEYEFHLFTDQYIYTLIIKIIRSKVSISFWDLTTYKRLKGIKKFIYKLFYIQIPLRISDKIVVLSNSVKEELINLKFATKEKIITIYGSPSKKFIDESDKYALLNNNNESYKDPYLLFIGNTQNKNLLRGLIAISDIPIQIVLVANNKLTNSEKSIIEKFKIDIKIFNKIDDKKLVELYRNSVCLIFISLSERMGLPPLEASYNKKYSILSNINMLKETTNNNAIFCNPYSINDIRSKIKYFLENKSKYDEKIHSAYLNSLRYMPSVTTNNYKKFFISQLKKKISKTVIVNLEGINLGLFRFKRGRPGIGNYLFTIYNAYSFAKERNYKFIFPETRQISNPFKNSFYRELGMHLGNRKIHELVVDFFIGGEKRYLFSKNFTKKYFLYPLNKDLKLKKINKEILAEFIKIIKIKTKIKEDEIDKNHAALHLRLGDFRKPNPKEKNLTNTSNPIDWYIKVITLLSKLQVNKIIIFSDQIDKAKLLFLDKDIKNMKIVFYEDKDAIKSLIKMSNYKYLIGSNSTFTLWSYLFSACNQKVFVREGFDYNYHINEAKFEEIK